MMKVPTYQNTSEGLVVNFPVDNVGDRSLRQAACVYNSLNWRKLTVPFLGCLGIERFRFWDRSLSAVTRGESTLKIGGVFGV
jgi:hypothetical protein